ncbi:hypothetical protein ACLOJK_005767 [Asimina triloba]
MAEPTTASARLDGRVAIVTGASRGIGRAIAFHLASLGAHLVLNYASSAADAENLANHINSSSAPSPRAIAVRANVADSAQVKALFDHAEAVFGGAPIHILVHAAGVLDEKCPTLADTSEADWDKTFDVNAKGSFLCCKEAANRLKRGGGGRIICLSSSMVGGLRPGYAAYAASKAAAETMIRILAKELKGTQITANCVAPRPIATDMFFAGKSQEAIQSAIDICPLGRLGETKDCGAFG